MGEILLPIHTQNFDEYRELAGKNGLAFEITDFAFPNVIEHEWKQRVQEYREILNGNKKFLGMHGAFMDIYINSPDPAIRKVSEERIIRNLQIAEQFGVKYIVFHTNSLPMMWNKSYYDNWVQAHVAFWKRILKTIRITILLENMWDKNPNHLLKVIEQVNSEKLKVCFDTGHCNLFSEVSMEQWFKTLGKHIVCIHINDNKGDGDYELAPGKGNIDWKLFDKCVKKYCSNPHVVLEVKDLKEIERSIRYLKKGHIFPFQAVE